MDNLVQELEELQLNGTESLWKKWIQSIQLVFVPEKLIGTDRPCEEKDFAEYRMTVNKNLQKILRLLQLLQHNRIQKNIEIDSDSAIVREFGIHMILLIGEQSEKSLWNNCESVVIAKDMREHLCHLFDTTSMSEMLLGRDDKFTAALLTLRPKLLKETWKTFPAAVTCYKWLLHQVEEPVLSQFIATVLPTALIIFDDFIHENRLIALECIYIILQHSYMVGIYYLSGMPSISISIYNSVSEMQK